MELSALGTWHNSRGKGPCLLFHPEQAPSFLLCCVFESTFIKSPSAAVVLALTLLVGSFYLRWALLALDDSGLFPGHLSGSRLGQLLCVGGPQDGFSPLLCILGDGLGFSLPKYYAPSVSLHITDGVACTPGILICMPCTNLASITCVTPASIQLLWPDKLIVIAIISNAFLELNP